MTPRRRRLIYPVFLPHAGCPYQCVYCNQRAVAAGGGRDDPVANALPRIAMYADQARRSRTSSGTGEIAFYGGTFTALPRSVLTSVLDFAAGFVEEGLFSGVRFSTRPDCIDDAVCDLLSRYPISAVELGAQSLCDFVLSASGRGYSSRTVFDACERVHERGWPLGLQLMAGLPEDGPDRFLDSVRAAIKARPAFMRIYPTLVLTGTPLAASYQAGTFRPLLLEQALDWIVPAFEMTRTAGIPLIRIGLHSDPELERPGIVLAGPYHPAFGSLVRSRWWRDRIDKAVSKEFRDSRLPLHQSVRSGQGLSGRLLVRVPSNQIGDVVGHGRSNILFWKNAWQLSEIKVVGIEDAGGEVFNISIE